MGFKDHVQLRHSYEPPSLKVIGSVHELTLQDKKSGASDGYFLLTVGPITNASP
ncbi:MAG TPA: lasso RiPP family leader peptide-containing protein [Gaiellaceae bacterium]